MSDDKILYIWMAGDIKRLPKIYALAEKPMSLTEFRDQYIDRSEAHVLLRVHTTTDTVGQAYQVEVTPIDEQAEMPPSLPESPPVEAKRSYTSLTHIKGIGPKTASLLQKNAGIHSVEDLALNAASAADRQLLAQRVGKHPETILRWAKLADLMRVDGVGEDYSALLLAAGIHTVTDLAAQQATHLHRMLHNTNHRHREVKRLPAEEEVADWIRQAQQLFPVVNL